MTTEVPLSAAEPSAVESQAKCPFHHAPSTGTTIHDWWPNRLKVEMLHQHSSKSDPMGGDFNYAQEFNSLNLAALKAACCLIEADTEKVF